LQQYKHAIRQIFSRPLTIERIELLLIVVYRRSVARTTSVPGNRDVIVVVTVTVVIATIVELLSSGVSLVFCGAVVDWYG